MRTRELLRLVRVNTLQNKGKVLLTSLGIIVGTATIVLVTAIGQGAKNEAAAQYSYLSADTVFVNLDYQQMDGNFDTARIEKLTPELLKAIGEENPYLSSLCLRSQNSVKGRIGRNEDYYGTAGVTPQYSQVFSLEFAAGGDFSDEDHESEKKVVALGGKLAEKQFGGAQQALGQRIRLGDNAFTVVGVLRASGDGLKGIDHDETIYLPWNTMKRCKLDSEYTIPQLTAKVTQLANVKRAMQRMNSTLRYYMDSAYFYKVEDAGS